MARHRARRHALQLLFQWDQRRNPPESDSLDDYLRSEPEIPLDQIIGGFYQSLLVSEESPNEHEQDEFAVELFRGVVSHSGKIDRHITKCAENWRIPRMPAVDRNILRLAVYEMLHTDAPPAVAIDEALELAGQFSGEESVHFINGVLDAVRRDLAPATPPAAHNV